MKNVLFLFFFILIYGCNKPKTVLICGDHVCINNSEAKQYFEDNLSLEVKVIDSKSKKEIDLVEINLKSKPDETRKITLLNKKNIKKKLKFLSDKQIKEKKADLKKRKKKKKKLSKVKRNIKQVRLSKKIIQNVNKKEKMIDICTILDKCNIEQISKYLINQGKNKKLPDITIRE